MRIAIATDAWHPQPNGVVRVVGAVVDRLRRLDHEALAVSPDRFNTLPCPTYAHSYLAPIRRTLQLAPPHPSTSSG